MHPVVRTLRALVVLAALSLGPSPLAPAASASVVLEDAYPGVTFSNPLYAVQPPDGTARMFVVEQGGRIWIVDHPAPPPPAVAAKRLFLDLSAAVSHIGNEEGLLGLAFHPGYATNGRFFVHFSPAYASSSLRRHSISEYHVSAGNADQADAGSARELLSIPQPYENHWGGWIDFGPDGMLYVALGDGGSGGDPENRSQNLADLHGKMLRIDVDGAGDYGVPADNPFVARPGARGEIFAYGLRNPWRCSFDRITGALWAGDVGQNKYEEVDRVVSGGNYGWRLREGMHPYTPGAPPADPLVEPVVEYGHAEGLSVTGGFVYRGTAIPWLAGSYVFADFDAGKVFALEDPYGTPTRTLLIDTDDYLPSFAEDRAGEPYLLSFSGKVLALRAGTPPPPGEGLPALLSGLHLGSGERLPYRVIAPLWADGAAKERYLLLPAGTSLGWRETDAFDLPVGGLAVKTFSRKGLRLETRVIRRTAEGFDAAAYRWRRDRTDADRVDDRTTLPGGEWTIPGPDDCRTCHLEAAGFLLGVTARQLEARTVTRWSRAGILSGAPPAGQVSRNVRLAAPRGLDARARSYLDANCAYCHRPEEAGNGSIDLRATTDFADTGILDAPPQRGDLGIADARIVAPGDPARSTLLARVLMTGDGRMPQLGTVVPDRAAARVLRRWIRGLHAER